jgi:integrase/recombinase XerD
VLTVRDSKFRKSRHVPIHPSTLRALDDYAAVRDRLCPIRQSSTFLVSRAGTRLLEQNVWFTFARLRKSAGLAHPDRRPPRIHDLRHTFAVKTLTAWYRQGIDVERRLPWLSTYLGHVSPSTTYWYLTATPELLALASERAGHAWNVP